MLSFRSILFAAAAFATVASAIPTPETGSGHTNIVSQIAEADRNDWE